MRCFGQALALASVSPLAFAELCTEHPSSSSSSTNNHILPREEAGLAKPAKSCPDFKDGPEQNACCPSQITHGAFFCCTQENKAQLEARLAAEARRRFISNHVVELVLGSILLLVALVLFGSYLCRRTRFCPWLHRRKSQSGGLAGAGRASLNGSLDSADFLGTVRQHHLHQHHRLQQQHRLLIPHRQFQQQGTVYQRPYQGRCTVSSEARKIHRATAPPATIIADAPPPYEEFDIVPPPPRQPPEAPPSAAAEVEELENRLNEMIATASPPELGRNIQIGGGGN